MMKLVIFVAVLVAFAAAQRNDNKNNNNANMFGPSVNIPCGFSCTKRAQFQSVIDGVFTSASCTATGGLDPRDRCTGCCGARALAAGISTEFASGFVSVNNNECVCCTFRRC